MTTSSSQTTQSKHDSRHAAAIYQLIELRLEYLTETVADFIRDLGEQPDRPRGYEQIAVRYEKIASEWLAEPIVDERPLATLLALAKFAAFVNVDRDLLNLITDNATIVGDEVDRCHVGIVLATLIKWIDRQKEAQLEAKMRREIGGAA